MKRTILSSVMVVALAALVAIPLAAQQPQGRGMGRGAGMGMGPGGPGGPGGPMAVLRGLELTDAQREQIRAIMDAERENRPAERVADLDKQLQLAILADTPDTPMVTSDVFDWSASYVRFFLLQTVRALRERVADSVTARVRNTILSAIRAAGEQGITNRELHRSKAFVTIARRERGEAIESLLEAELIAWTDVPTTGRTRRALVALQDDAAELQRGG